MVLRPQTRRRHTAVTRSDYRRPLEVVDPTRWAHPRADRLRQSRRRIALGLVGGVKRVTGHRVDADGEPAIQVDTKQGAARGRPLLRFLSLRTCPGMSCVIPFVTSLMLTSL